MTEDRSEGGGGETKLSLTRLLFGTLTLGISEIPRMLQWTASKLTDAAEGESLDEGKVLAELMELQERYDVDDIKEEEYDRQEKALLERLSAIREAKKKQNQ
jgi:hypothetical protein